VLISADSHVVEPPDLWVERLPRRWRDDAPRAERDPRNHHWYFRAPGIARGVDLTLSRSAGMTTAEVDAALAEDPDAPVGTTGGHDPVVRLADLWRDDTVADVLYPTAGLTLLQLDDAELQLECFRVYNDWLAEICSVDPDRLLGHGLIPTWDIDVAVNELRRCRHLGLRGAIIWTSPPMSDSFFDRRYDGLWAAASELHMPVSLHTLAGRRESAEISRFGSTVESTFYFGFRTRDELQRSLCELIAGGVFERFPELRVIGAEGGINYAAVMEQRLDSGFRSFWGRLDHGLRLLPSEYFRRNVYLTYISDPIGLNNVRFTGADHFMWSGDYPHGAASWPNSVETITRECADVGLGAETIKKLTLDNVASLYDIDLERVRRPSAVLEPAVVAPEATSR
jgi:predicted TIM-barrel fold metal-dependent hydrolase